MTLTVREEDINSLLSLMAFSVPVRVVIADTLDFRLKLLGIPVTLSCRLSAVDGDCEIDLTVRPDLFGIGRTSAESKLMQEAGGCSWLSLRKKSNGNLQLSMKDAIITDCLTGSGILRLDLFL